MSTAAPKSSVSAIASFLQSGGIVQKFRFPRLHMPGLPGYNPADYAVVGAKIAAGDIPVYIAKGKIDGALAFYNLTNNTLNLTPETAPLNTPQQWSTIAHEATHIIQDKNKWRMTQAQMEADAHFAQALFLHYKGCSLGTGYMPSFDPAAEAFAKGDIREFKSRCNAMLREVGTKYRYQTGYEDLFIKKKQDGI